jgi:hypothetical protein
MNTVVCMATIKTLKRPFFTKTALCELWCMKVGGVVRPVHDRKEIKSVNSVVTIMHVFHVCAKRCLADGY